MPGYSDKEIEAIAGWLRDDLTAGEIAARFSRQFRLVTRNAMIGIVQRNKALKAIGFTRRAARTREDAPRPAGRSPSGRRGFVPVTVLRGMLADLDERDPAAFVRPDRMRLRQPEPDGVSPATYDAESRRLPLEALAWSDCRWPVNHAAKGEAHLFCGLPKAQGSYCLHHHHRSVGAGTRSELGAEAALLRLSGRRAA